jgi:hypothetical protein
MGFQGPVNLPNNVAPNEEVTISVRLVAPSPIGTHVGSFLLQNDTGGHFGLGSNKTPFTVQVITTNYHKEPTPTKKH